MSLESAKPEAQPAAGKSRSHHLWRRGQIILALVLLGAIVLQAGPEQLLKVVGNADGFFVFACLLSITLSYYLRALTFALIARPYARLAIGPVFLFTLIGAFFSNVLPGQIGGDFVKGAYLVRYFQSGSRAFAAVAMHRMLGFAGTLVAGGALTLAMSQLGRNALFKPGLLLLFAGTMLVALPCFWGKTFWLAGRLLPGEQFRSTRAGLILSKFASALEGYSKHTTLVVVSAVLSALLSLQGALSLLLAAWAVGLHQSPLDGITAGLFAQLSAFLPLTPGGAGVTEQAYVVACSYLGFDVGLAAAAALLFRLCMLTIGCAGGVLYMRIPLPPVRRQPDSVADSERLSTGHHERRT